MIDKDIEIVTFSVGKYIYGIDIVKIVEINKQTEITKAHNAPDHVVGLINLRGFVVTVLDLRIQFDLPEHDEPKDKKIIVVNDSGGESIGLLVDDIDDILKIKESEIVSSPPNASNVQTYFSGIYQSEGPLIIILNIEEILKIDWREKSKSESFNLVLTKISIEGVI